MQQCTLSFTSAEEVLEEKLAALVNAPVKLILTQNRSTYYSSQWRWGSLEMRIHRAFASADDDVIKALARIALRRDRRVSAKVGEFFHAVAPRHEGAARRKMRCIEKGSHYNLKEIYERLNGEYFEGAIDAEITWGKRFTGRRKRQINLGSYCEIARRITIHPTLDREVVPHYVVEATVYHEMCHQAVKSTRTPSGTNRHHTKEFRAQEKRYPLYEEAKRWEKKNLNMLLTS